MTTKLRFLFVLLTMLWWGANFAWAATHTITFDYSENGLLRTKYVRATGGNSTTITSSPITLTFNSSSTRSVNTNTSSGTMKFEGPKEGNAGTSLEVSCTSDALITSVVVTSAATENVSHFTASVGTYTAESTATTGTWIGSVTTVTFTTNGNVDQVTSITVTYTDVIVPYSNTYPYTWDFTKWEHSASDLNANTSFWKDGTYQQELYNADSNIGTTMYLTSGTELTETKGLKFWINESTKKRIFAVPDEYLGLYVSSIFVPNLKSGYKVIFVTDHQSNSDNISVSSVSISKTSSGNTDTYTYEVPNSITSPQEIKFDFAGNSSSAMHLLSIAVVKSDLTTFAHNISGNETYYGLSSPSSGKLVGAFIGKTTTFQYKLGRDQELRTRVDIAPGLDITGIDVNNTNFSVTSNATSVLDPTGCYVDYYNSTTYHKFKYGNIKVKKPGTANLTYRFNGTDAYNAKEYTEQFTIQKDDPVLEFISSFLIKKVGDENFRRNITLNGLSLPEGGITDDNAGTINVTYSSDNTSVATVSSTTGWVTIGSTPGVAYITATLAATDYNNEVKKEYKLIVNPASGTNPTLSWNGDVTSVSVPYNNEVTRTASVNNNDQTVLYSSANPSIASVDEYGKVTGTGVGTTKIYAMVDPTSTYNAVQIEYEITVTKAGDLTSLRFVPNNGKVNNGKSITPKLAFPTIPNDGVTSLKVTQIQVLERNGIAVSESALTTDAAIEACDIISIDDADDLKNNWILNADGKVNKVNVTINGKAIGKAEITVTFTSTYYNTATAKYTIEVTDALTTNFSWADGNGSPEYYTYAGDYMMLPAISGNSNGNNNYSNGAKNSSSYTENGTSHSALQKYKYEIKNGSVKWNSKDIKIGEGFPDFEIVTDGISSPGAAAVFFGRGEGGDHPDTLMIYCQTAGDVKLRAYDPQDHSKYCDATIHILPIANITGSTGAATTVTNSMAYPYTWDFTTNFDMSALVGGTDRYWTPMKDSSGNPTGDYTNGYGFFNLDWADENANSNTSDRIFKHFIAGASSSKTGYMSQFNGMSLQLKGSTSWANKMDRMRIMAYDGNGTGRLVFNGGPHIIKMPLPSTKPSSYKIFVKASGTGSVNINADENTSQAVTSEAKILSFDSSQITTTSDNCIKLGFDDVRVYWIAMSTEAKTIWKRSNTSYPAATYSYTEDLDFGKSQEANNSLMPGSNLQAYYASNVAPHSVTLTEVPVDAVRAGQGVVIKTTQSTDGSYDCYMIANQRNTESYSTPSTIPEQAGSGTNNYLVATTGGETIPGTDGGYHNFLLSYYYDWYNYKGVITESNILTDDWAFYRIHGSISGAPSKNAYLHTTVDSYYFNQASARSLSEQQTTEDEKTQNEKNLLYLTFVNRDGSKETTAIDSARKDQMLTGKWYTLQGVLVTTPTKGGIYIHNGRKVVIK